MFFLVIAKLIKEIIKYQKYICISFQNHSEKYKLTMEDMPMYRKEKLDMTAFGQAVKEARERKGWSREKLAEMLDLAPRYIMYIETRGQHLSLQRLYDIATLFSISIDQFFFPNTTNSKTTQRLQLDIMLNSMDEKELSVIAATVKAMQEAKTTGE